MKLAAIVSVLNQFPIARQTIKYLLEGGDYDIVVIDNGSDEEFHYDDARVEVVRVEEPIGSYPVFFLAPQVCDADILAYFHSDFFVYDKDWDKKVLAEFEKDAKLGMIGFIGSNEIDQRGGRGLGTASNFIGRLTEQDTMSGNISLDFVPQKWSGSPAEAHGKRITGFMNAAVVDGCSMIIRRTALEDIGSRKDFPPHHFYDRLISTQLLEKQWKIGVLGIACDHISGQTVNQEPKYWEMAKEWAQLHGINPGGMQTNWDSVIYQEAEKQWLHEYRDQKHLVPIKVK